MEEKVVAKTVVVVVGEEGELQNETHLWKSLFNAIKRRCLNHSLE